MDQTMSSREISRNWMSRSESQHGSVRNPTKQENNIKYRINYRNNYKREKSNRRNNCKLNKGQRGEQTKYVMRYAIWYQ